MKVKEESDALLMLAGLIPDYVSQNCSDGKIECERFFPDGYKNAEEEKQKEAEVEDGDEEMEVQGEEGLSQSVKNILQET